jgi:hypothetical protein
LSNRLNCLLEKGLAASILRFSREHAINEIAVSIHLPGIGAVCAAAVVRVSVSSLWHLLYRFPP